MSKKSLTDKSWYILDKISEDIYKDEEFEDLWREKPDEKNKMMMFGREVEVPRWQKTYGELYKFTGMEEGGEKEIPDKWKKIFEWAKKYEPKYNQLLVNWYENGSDYIGFHKDDEKEIKDNSNIFSLTLSDKNGERRFVIKDNNKKKIDEVKLTNRVYVVMGGHFQKELYHGVPKTEKECGRRINVTCRYITNN